MKPEKKTLGSRKTMDICSACIWFSALVPTSKPRLSSANTYTSVENIMEKTLPSIGTKNTKRIMVNKTTAMVMPMQRYGTSLPSMSPAGLNGLTSNCSSVPRSRSRTKAMAAATVVPICKTTPITPGTKKFGARMAGL